MDSNAPQLSSNWRWHSIRPGNSCKIFSHFGWFPFQGRLILDAYSVPVLVQEVALQTCLGRIFAAPVCPLVWGRLLHWRCLWGFSSGGCPGLFDRDVVQQVMAVCDQWVWFYGTTVSVGVFRFEKSSFNWFHLALNKTIATWIVWGACHMLETQFSCKIVECFTTILGPIIGSYSLRIPCSLKICSSILTTVWLFPCPLAICVTNGNFE